MPGRSKASIVAAETKPARKPKAASVRVPDHLGDPQVSTSEMLRQIKIRGDKLSSEIRDLLVRLG